MDVDRAGLDVAVVAPDAFEEPISGQHPVAVLDEEFEQVELAAGQANGLVIDRDRDRVEVGAEMPSFVNRRRRPR